MKRPAQSFAREWNAAFGLVVLLAIGLLAAGLTAAAVVAVALAVAAVAARWVAMRRQGLGFYGRPKPEDERSRLRMP